MCKEASVLSDARGIFEREGIPTVAKVGDAAAYGSCSSTCSDNLRLSGCEFLESVRDAATRHELPEDAVAFAEARFRQTEIEKRYRTQHRPILSCGIRSHASPKMIRPSERGRDSMPEKMEEVDRRTGGPLKAI